MDLTWLIDKFVSNVSGIKSAIIVSSDGLLLAMPSFMKRESADHLSAITSGLMSLSYGSSKLLNMGALKQIFIEMGDGYLLIIPVGSGTSYLSVLTETATCDLGHIGYEMTLLVEKCRSTLVARKRGRLEENVT